MKRLLLTILILILFVPCGLCGSGDWSELYENSKVYAGKLMNDIDPYRDEDNQKYAYSPYPLFRTAATLYHKKITISPGYYQLVPRNIGGGYHVLFEANGKVQYIVPVVKKSLASSADYQRYIPKAKKTKAQKAGEKWTGFWKKRFKNSAKQPPPPANIEMIDEGTFYVLKLYFGENCYVTVYKKYPY